jgi:hypothetical protein
MYPHLRALGFVKEYELRESKPSLDPKIPGSKVELHGSAIIIAYGDVLYCCCRRGFLLVFVFLAGLVFAGLRCFCFVLGGIFGVVNLCTLFD